MKIAQRSRGPGIPMEQWVMAAKEELYAKVTPRRQRQNRPNTIKHGSTLDVLLSMGFPKTRAWVHTLHCPTHTHTHTHTVTPRLNQASQQHPWYSLSSQSFMPVPPLCVCMSAADLQHLCSLSVHACHRLWGHILRGSRQMPYWRVMQEDSLSLI